MIELTMVIGAVTGLVQACKMAGLPSKYAPIVSVALGVALAFLFGEVTLGEKIFTGIISGLSASGLYSGAKTITKK